MLKIALSGCCGRMGHVINDIVSGRGYGDRCGI